MEALIAGAVVVAALTVSGVLCWRVLDDAKKVQTDALELTRDLSGLQRADPPTLTRPAAPNVVYRDPDGSMVVLDPNTGAPLVRTPEGVFTHPDGTPVANDDAEAGAGEWGDSDVDLPFTDPTYIGANDLDNVGFGTDLPPDVAEMVASGDDGRRDRAAMIRPGEDPFAGLTGLGEE